MHRTQEDFQPEKRPFRKPNGRFEAGRRPSGYLGDLGLDIRFGLRLLRWSPGFSAIVISMLAIGIGTTAAAFNVVDGVLLQALPIHDQDRVVLLHKELRGDESLVPFNQPDFIAFRTQSQAFEHVAGVQYDGAFPYPVVDGDRTMEASGAAISGDFFQVLGMRPAIGRFPTPDDEDEALSTVVISHSLWTRGFGADPGVLERQVVIGGGSVRIIGVAPADFQFPKGSEMWLPYRFPPEIAASRQSGLYSLVGRLRPGVSLEQAREEAFRFLNQREPLYESFEPRGQRAVLTPIQEVVVGEVRTGLMIVSSAVGLVLLITTINVGTMLLIRGSRRERELAVRSALGAGRGRIGRQLATESAILGGIGGLLAIVVLHGSIHGFLSLAPLDLPRFDQVRVDGRVLAFVVATSIAVTLILGLIPTLWSLRTNFMAPLRGDKHAGEERRSLRYGKEMLVVGQIALALIVIIGGGLLTRSYSKLQSVDMGYDASRLTLVKLAVPQDLYTAEGRRDLAFFAELSERLQGIGGIESVTPVVTDPLSGMGGWDLRYVLDGQSESEAITNPALNLEPILPNYFETLGLTILRGRAFTDFDRNDALSVAVVSNDLARRLWPGEDPLGKRLRRQGTTEWMTIVGVAGDSRYRDLINPRETLYVPLSQATQRAGSLLVRTTPASAIGVLGSVRSTLVEVEPLVSVVTATPVSSHIERELARPRFEMTLVAGFGAISLLLAAIGLWGLIAAFVAQRFREFGIRMALGADASDLRSLVLRRGLILTLSGVVIGTFLALLGMQALRSMLFEISPADPITFACMTIVLSSIALLAAYVPARRVTRADPMALLRRD